MAVLKNIQYLSNKALQWSHKNPLLIISFYSYLIFSTIFFIFICSNVSHNGHITKNNEFLQQSVSYIFLTAFLSTLKIFIIAFDFYKSYISNPEEKLLLIALLISHFFSSMITYVIFNFNFLDIFNSTISSCFLLKGLIFDTNKKDFFQNVLFKILPNLTIILLSYSFDFLINTSISFTFAANIMINVIVFIAALNSLYPALKSFATPNQETILEHDFAHEEILIYLPLKLHLSTLLVFVILRLSFSLSISLYLVINFIHDMLLSMILNCNQIDPKRKNAIRKNSFYKPQSILKVPVTITTSEKKIMAPQNVIEQNTSKLLQRKNSNTASNRWNIISRSISRQTLPTIQDIENENSLNLENQNNDPQLSTEETEIDNNPQSNTKNEDIFTSKKDSFPQRAVSLKRPRLSIVPNVGSRRQSLIGFKSPIPASSGSNRRQSFAVLSSKIDEHPKATRRSSSPDKEFGFTQLGRTKFQVKSLSQTDITDCMSKINQGLGNLLFDWEILSLLESGHIKSRQLEQIVQNHYRAVTLRRQDLVRNLPGPYVLDTLPYEKYDYKAIFGQCCEEVIGYVPFPLGKVGPLLLDGKSHYIPVATTEGCLVASTNRGCRAVELCGGIQSVVYRNQMTRAPVVYFKTIMDLAKCKVWIETSDGFKKLKMAFDSTSSHANLISALPIPCGTYLHIRFAAQTGEAMGMNMVSKGTEKALRVLKDQFPNMEILGISGNTCADKKPSSINWILGRGKSVIAECRIDSKVLSSVLHTTAEKMARLCITKNWTGSAMAGTLGGFNAHAANLVAAVFAATGQDIAQVVDSSACLTLMLAEPDGSLHVTCTMPCIEVGTVGGGTRLSAQRACLNMMDLSVNSPTEHLACLVAGTVLCAEVSLMAALSTSELVEAHMRLNRANHSTDVKSMRVLRTNREGNRTKIVRKHSIM